MAEEKQKDYVIDSYNEGHNIIRMKSINWLSSFSLEPLKKLKKILMQNIY